jgi:Signal transduction histidine kinase
MRYFSYLRYIGILLFVLVCNKAQADATIIDVRVPRIDSLKNIINTQTLTQKQQLDIMFDITFCYAGFEMDSTIVWSHKSLSLAEKLNNTETEFLLYINLGVAHCFKSNYDSAFIFIDQANEIAQKIGNKEMEALVISFYAFIYVQQGKYLSAVDYYMKCLPIYENMELADGTVKILTNLSEINRKLGNTIMAIQYLELAEQKYIEFQKSQNYDHKWRLAHIYNEYATNYLELKDLSRATEYATKADSLSYDGIINKCYAKNLLARIQIEAGDYEQALQYAEKAMEQADILKDKNLYVMTRKVLSDIYMAQKRYSEAEAEALKAWLSDSTNIDDSRFIAENIALANIYLHNTKKAAYYQKRYSELNKQYSEKSFQTTMSDMAVKYETEKKELRIATLEKEKKLQYLITFLGVFTFLIITILFFLNRKQKIKQLEQEKQIIASQAIIEGETEERRRLARDLHDGLGGMLSVVKINLDNIEHLQNARELLGKSIDELRRLSHNLMPSALQYGLSVALEEFCNAIPNAHFHFYGTETQIDEKIKLLFYRCTYELVNNAVKHAKAENINVQLVQEANRIALTVTDDGCGFDTNLKTLGMGLQNIKDRVVAFNGTIEIVSAPEKGTEVFIVLKVEN